MSKKGVRNICFSPRTPSWAYPPCSSPLSSTVSTPRRSFTESVLEQTIDDAASMIMKWNPETSTFAKVNFLFQDSKREAMQFLRCVAELQKTMHLLSSQDSTNDRFVQAQSLMTVAMKRLQKEFHQILSVNRAHLDPESVSTGYAHAFPSSTCDLENEELPDDQIRVAGDSISEVEQVSSMVICISDLKSIAECMISAGYATECVSVYNIFRKSIIDEGIYRLGVEKLSSSQVEKMDWEALDARIKTWVDAVEISMATLFTGERILCDQIFGVSDAISESVYSYISKEGASLLFSFPKLVAKRKKPLPPEKMFRVLDMYSAISESWGEIDSIFSFESTSSIREEALASLVRLSESVLLLLSGFESTIVKDSSKTPVPGAGLHPLTTHAINYLTILSNYSNVLTDIISDWPPLTTPSLPESYYPSPDSDGAPAPVLSVRFAWLILVLLCKLDGKAKHYKNVSLAYLFLANNLQHIVSGVRTSNLQYVFGEDWITKHEAKAREFAAKYERLAWGHVFESLQHNLTALESPDEAKERFKQFNSSFEEAFRKQSSCMVPCPKLRDEIMVSIEGKLTPVYRDFHDKCRVALEGQRNVGLFIRYAPEDIADYLSNLFLESIDSGSSTSSSMSRSHRQQRI